MKMKDMAENYEKMHASPSSQQPYYPSFRVTDKQLPEAGDWKMGKSYKVCMKIKLIGIAQNGTNPKEYHFEMRKIGVYKDAISE